MISGKHDGGTVKKIENRFKLIKPKLSLRLRKTITFDQGKENAQHEEMSKRLKMDVYFYHPGSPWEKATCENTTGLIRDFLNGENDFRKMNQRYFSKIARLLNNRPRPTLGYKTPNEKFVYLR